LSLTLTELLFWLLLVPVEPCFATSLFLFQIQLTLVLVDLFVGLEDLD
jgi:hypothetical protein